MYDVILGLGFLAAIYMAWNIGANDVANAMASAVGAKAITLRQAVVIGGVLDFAGAVLLGSHVTTTIRKNILDSSLITDPQVMMLGLLAALLASAFWVFFATWSQFPVSTTHSIVGALIGFGIVAGGFGAVKWGPVAAIVVSWVLSPVFAGLLAYLTFVFIRAAVLRRPRAFLAALRWSPLFAGLAVLVTTASLLMETPLGTRLGIGNRTGFIYAVGFSTLIGVVARGWVSRTIRDIEGRGVEEMFRWFQVFTSCYVAFAHGANDVANAIGPVAGIYVIYTTHSVTQEAPVPIYLLLLGGFFIALGVFTWGYRVIETVGSKITTLTNTRGYAVDFGTATSVLVASKLGLPVSTTHAAVGAVIGVGLGGGLAAVDFKVVWKIMIYWVVTLPLSAIPTMIIFKALRMIFI